MSLIKGIHHVALKCSTPEEYAETRRFYGEILGIELLREWSGGCMFNTGSGIIEVFNNGTGTLPQGAVCHFALATDNVDACIAAVRAEGYKITTEPGDVTVQSAVPFPLRMAFCIGPVGEEIEFFMEY